MNKYTKNIIFHVASIIYTSLFLIVSTYIWFYKKDFSLYNEVNNTKFLVSNDILLNLNNEVSSYNFDIENISNESETFKVYVVSDVLSNNVTNNYIKYIVNDNKVKTLNMDGIIYIDNLDISETKNIDLKIWISDTYIGSLNYTGYVIVS